ncbi:hypothetical protein [Helicobacter suis]|uniref:hypothetical protein n=1 Tax=Helicobacter suis TaxID=104628 RepID=UPI0013D44232|nr:hypothetical protein [Helicobacter suis]
MLTKKQFQEYFTNDFGKPKEQESCPFEKIDPHDIEHIIKYMGDFKALAYKENKSLYRRFKKLENILRTKCLTKQQQNIVVMQLYLFFDKIFRTNSFNNKALREKVAECRELTRCYLF